MTQIGRVEDYHGEWLWWGWRVDNKENGHGIKGSHEKDEHDLDGGMSKKVNAFLMDRQEEQATRMGKKSGCKEYVCGI